MERSHTDAVTCGVMILSFSSAYAKAETPLFESLSRPFPLKYSSNEGCADGAVRFGRFFALVKRFAYWPDI